VRADSRIISRRGFLVLTAGTAVAGLAACGSAPSGPTPVRIEPNSPQVAAAEKRRRGAGAATTSVSLTTTEGAMDLGATQVITWTYGGELPGREIRVKRGAVLKVDLSNTLSVPTTIHWHGIALRNDMDGVPDLTQSEIKAGGRFSYEFAVPDAGTYWFHPHVGTQLDTGLYAPLIVEDPEDGDDYDTELVIVLDDWLDGGGRSPDDVLADLRTNGMPMEHSGMPGMSMPRSDLLGGDVGDVTYPHMLANGRTATAPHTFAVKPGQRVRLRLINAGSDTAFRVGVPDVRMTVTHTDGFPVVPVEADTVLLGMGERLDAIITVPGSTVPLLALAEGRDAHAQVILQSGRPVDPAASRGGTAQHAARTDRPRPRSRGVGAAAGQTTRHHPHADARRSRRQVRLDDQQQALRPERRPADSAGSAGATAVREQSRKCSTRCTCTATPSRWAAQDRARTR
jgi:FtsP/CotA-like multicopper oxidase with cupredoxin domain